MDETDNGTTTGATKKPRNEETIKRQILTNARKYLAELAEKRRQDTENYVPPTEDELKAECKKRWQRHLDRKAETKEDVSSFFD